MTIKPADSQANPNVLFFLPSLSALSGSKELTTAYTQARVEQAHINHRSTKGLLYTCFFQPTISFIRLN